MVWGLAPLLSEHELCQRQLDPQQLVARMRHHVWTNHPVASFAVSQLVCIFGNVQHVRTSFVNLPARTHAALTKDTPSKVLVCLRTSGMVLLRGVFRFRVRTGS